MDPSLFDPLIADLGNVFEETSPAKNRRQSSITEDLDSIAQMIDSASGKVPRAPEPPAALDFQSGILQAGWSQGICDQIAARLASSGLPGEVWVIHLTPTGKVRRITTNSLRLQRVRSGDRRILQSAWVGVATDAAHAGEPLHYGLTEKAPPSAILDALQRDESWKTIAVLPSLLAENEGNLVLAFASQEPTVGPMKDQLLPLLDQTLNQLGKAYLVWDRVQLASHWKKIRTQLAWLQKNRWQTVTAAILLSLMVFAIPIPHRPTRKGTLHASSRHFIACPIEGKLLESFVRPGDIVQKGQLLARMEDVPMRRELASAEAALESARKKRDVALASQMASDLRLAQLEFHQAQIRIDSIRERLTEMEITSPADGIVLQGDWHGNNGRPLSFGQSLFEIGSLEKMTVEVRLLAEDIPWVGVDSTAKLLSGPEGAPTISGKLCRIEPQATLLDEQVVFLAEFPMTETSTRLRPGMEVSVRVDARWHSLGWLLFRKPYRWIANQWVW